MVIMRDPEPGSTNLAGYRVMVQDARTLTVFIELASMGDSSAKNWYKGEACPIVGCVGQFATQKCGHARGAGRLGSAGRRISFSSMWSRSSSFIRVKMNWGTRCGRPGRLIHEPNDELRRRRRRRHEPCGSDGGHGDALGFKDAKRCAQLLLDFLSRCLLSPEKLEDGVSP